MLLSTQFKDKMPNFEVLVSNSEETKKEDPASLAKATEQQKEIAIKETGLKDTGVKPKEDSTTEKQKAATIDSSSNTATASSEKKEAVPSQKNPKKSSEEPPKEKALASAEKDASKNVEILGVENPSNAVYLDDKPLSINKKEKVKKVKKKKRKAKPVEEPVIKIESNEDLAFYHREGWRKANLHSYEPAKRTFQEILKINSTDPISLFGLGYVEERIAERYFRDGEHALAREQRESARKRYCKALALIEQEESYDIVFLRSQINSHLLGLQSDCPS